MAGKKYQKLKESLPKQTVSVQEGVEWLKQNVQSKYDPTIEVHIHLGVDPGKSEQTVRSQVVLPAGSPKQKKIAVFTSNAALQTQATKAGAAVVGGQELIDEVAKKGSLEADMAIATPDMMPKIAKIARILGPKGLMPNPKTGTVTPDPVAAMKELLTGKTPFKMDSTGNIHEGVAKLSWDTDKIVANIRALIDATSHARPATSKGQFIKAIYVKSTTSPAVQVIL
jgi:large subunit ribosomal protein L1